MSDQPTGEWTLSGCCIRVQDGAIICAGDVLSAVELRNYHNAALAIRQQHIDNLDKQLAADREIKSAEKKILLDVISKNQQLREQLAAEREKQRQEDWDELAKLENAIQQLREQLAAAKAEDTRLADQNVLLHDQLDSEREASR